MSWNVYFHPSFQREVYELSVLVRRELIATVGVLEEYGPMLGRPEVDTLKDSKYKNMKELRFNADGGVWRVAFAFDPERNAILLVAGDKSGGSERTFYRRLIEKAERRYREHLEDLI